MEKWFNVSNVSGSKMLLFEPEGTEHENLYAILRIAQLVLLVVIFAVGAIGNISVMVLVWRKGRKRKVKHVFMCHLAFADSLVIIVSLPIKIHDEYSPTGRVPQSLWILWTKILPSLVPFSVLLSVFTMVGMAWERHHVIVHPFKEPIGKTLVLKIIIVQWILAMITVTPITYTSVYDGENLYNDWGSQINLQMFTLCQVLIEYFIPLGIIFLYHIMIIRYVRQIRRNISWLTRARQCRKILRKNLKLYKKCLMTITVFAICIFPEILFSLWTDFGSLGDYEHSGILGGIGSLFVITQSAINPSIYANFDQLLFKKIKRCFLMCSADEKNKKTRSPSLLMSMKTQFPTIFSGSGKSASSNEPNIELETL